MMSQNFSLSRLRQPELAVKTPPKEPEEKQLARQDPIPCDADKNCESAKWVVFIPEDFALLSLYFCNHHFCEHLIDFITKGYEIRNVILLSLTGTYTMPKPQYGWPHQKARRDALTVFKYCSRCRRCNRPMLQWHTPHLDHTARADSIA